MNREKQDEDRLVRRLAAEGLLTPSPLPAITRGLAMGLAGLALFAGGWGVARWTPATADLAGEAYVMLLYPGVDVSADDPGRAAEYGTWARDAQAGGRVVGGFELERPVAVLGPPAAGAPTGLFVIRAASPDAAVRLARSTPHLRHGGSVVVRETPAGS